MATDTLEVIEATAVEVERQMTEAQARRLTDKVRKQVGEVHSTLLRIHDEKGWKALGYASWKDYCVEELGMSRSSAYNALQVAKLRNELEAAGVEGAEVTVRDAAVLAADAEAAAAEIASDVQAGYPVDEAIDNAAERRSSNGAAEDPYDDSGQAEASPEELRAAQAKEVIATVRAVTRLKPEEVYAVLDEGDYRRLVGNVRKWAMKADALLTDVKTARASEEVEPNFKKGR